MRKQFLPQHPDKKKSRKIRLLFLGDFMPTTTTGFATLNHNVLYGLLKRYGDSLDITVCGVNYFGEPVQLQDNLFLFSAVKSQKIISQPDSYDEFGRNGFLWMLYNNNADPETDNTPREEIGYDGIFIIQDISVAAAMAPILATIKKRFRDERKKDFKSMFYFPMDCTNIYPLVKDIDFFDTLVTYNEFSRQEILRLKPDLRKKLKVLPHGNNPRDFYPLPAEEKKAFRDEFFGEHASKDIIINLNRNQPRKDIPTTIFAFEEYRKTNPNAFLYLHMDPTDKMGWNLPVVFQATNLVEDEHYMFPPIKPKGETYSTAEINKIYNACDVYLTTTLGEGWGLGVTEAMACRLPVIAPMHTSLSEIGDHGARVYPLEELIPDCHDKDSLKRWKCNYLEVEERLNEVFENIVFERQEHFDKVQKAFDYVESLHWDGIVDKWEKLVDETF